MNNTIISTSATVAYLSLVSVKNTFIFVGCYNVATPVVAFSYATPICTVVTFILANFN